MPAYLRRVLLAIVCLAAGFLAGWFSKPTSALALPSAPKREALNIPVGAGNPDRSLQQQTISTSPPVDRTLRNRIEVAAGLKRRQEVWFLSIFENDGFNRSLALMLGLNPTEIQQLSAAYRQTKKRLDDLKTNATTSQLSADGTTLTVSVPALTTESGPLYTDLLNTTRLVLGLERYSIFNEIAGVSFDRTFDRFGLNSATYELTLKPASMAGDAPVYSLKTSSFDAGGDGTTLVSTQNVTRANLEQNNPRLAHFFPSDPGK